jgi:type I site-specific restriction endonuclease
VSSGMVQAIHYAELMDVPFSFASNRDGFVFRDAINRSVAAIANGQNRVLLVMATGTGKTYTAFQIIWRL